MDCLEGLKLIPDKSIDLIVTDPPYLIKGIHEYKGNDLGKHIINYQKPLVEQSLTDGYDVAILDEMYRVMKVPNFISGVISHKFLCILNILCWRESVRWIFSYGIKQILSHAAIINGSLIKSIACISERVDIAIHLVMQKQEQYGICLQM